MTAKTTEKTVNYTPEQTARAMSVYSANPTPETVAALAAEMGKTARSIVAKLSREGVYKRKAYVTKSGEPSVKKDDHADAIGAILKLSENDTESLTKCNKTALAAIFKALAASVPTDTADTAEHPNDADVDALADAHGYRQE